MVSIFFAPIVGETIVSYKIEGQKITVSMNGFSDIFDFTDLPEGRTTVDQIETVLDPPPIIEAEKRNGVLFLTVLNFIKEGATEFERFPNWIEVGE